MAGAAEKDAHSAAEQLRGQMRAAEDSSREAEKTIFRLLARKSEIDGILREVGARAEALAHAEADFKRELQEAAVVAGRGAVQYGDILNSQNQDRVEQEERRRKIERLKIRIEDSGTSGADDVLKEYNTATEREAFLARELADLEHAAESLKGLIAELGEKLDREFKEGITRINTEFQKLFSLMFGGGTAKVLVVKAPRRVRRGAEEDSEENGENESDEFMRAQSEEAEAEEGVEVEVSIPRKKIKGLMMLSGGERALTSIALIFALSAVKPPPFIILDETDAALDEANSKRYGDMIENLSKHSQLILITHNRETMSRAGVLYGITMERGASKLLSLAFEEAAAVAK